MVGNNCVSIRRKVNVNSSPSSYTSSVTAKIEFKTDRLDWFSYISRYQYFFFLSLTDSSLCHYISILRHCTVIERSIRDNY